MKSYQKIKSAFYSFFLLGVLLLISEISNAQYARLERQDSYGYRENTGDTEYPIHDYSGANYYVRLYSDAACTIPATASGDIIVTMNYTNYYDEGLNYGGETYIYETIGVGESEKFIAHVYLWDLYYDIYNTGWGLYTTLPGVSFSGSPVTYVGAVDL